MEKKDLALIIRGFEEEDITLLRELGAKYAREGAITESHSSLEAGAISYALSKLLQREYPSELWGPFKKNSLELLKKVNVTDGESMNKTLDKILDNISDFDQKTGKFAWNLKYKARANKATTAYASGLSAGKAAHLSGVSKWEILRYAGNTRLPDEVGITHDLNIRLENARKVLII
jgi:hypothetical protein